MRFLIWLLRAVIFVLLFGLAIKNSGPVDLRLYFDAAWQAPLSLVMLVCFAVGAVIGATAAMATLMMQRRELAQLRRLHNDAPTLHSKAGSR
jgi:putative membrane protein